jgi:hypothetical protein
MEAALGVEQAVGGKDVEVRMEEEVIAEGVDSGHSGEAATAARRPSGSLRRARKDSSKVSVAVFMPARKASQAAVRICQSGEARGRRGW